MPNSVVPNLVRLSVSVVTDPREYIVRRLIIPDDDAATASKIVDPMSSLRSS